MKQVIGEMSFTTCSRRGRFFLFSRRISEDWEASTRGGAPASKWYMVAPKAYMSVRKSSSPRNSVSGAA